jgi:hypothetical protein
MSLLGTRMASEEKGVGGVGGGGGGGEVTWRMGGGRGRV